MYPNLDTSSPFNFPSNYLGQNWILGNLHFLHLSPLLFQPHPKQQHTKLTEGFVPPPLPKHELILLARVGGGEKNPVILI